jgi:hypothetical protein
MFVILDSNGDMRLKFVEDSAESVIELALELQCSVEDSDFRLRLAEAQRLLREDTKWVS